ncbi:MAG TPA: TolC family protein [Flavobacteriaceae bacterium]|nr:TolC family protein [Flavobacteriaceae bacterium]
MKLTALITNKSLWIFSLLILGGSQVKAQEILEDYVEHALENNLVLQKKNIELQQAEYALKIAKGMFYPSVDMHADYTSAEGGRDIYLPLGDMLNPVYNTLNALTSSNMFPQLENERVNFLPHNFYDAKIRASVPIFNAEMIYNKRVKKQQLYLTEEEQDIYKRDLIEKVKSAYYDYLQAHKASDIYSSTLELAEEGKRVNESLLENGKGLPAYVLRSESEVAEVEAKITEAEQNLDNAKRYFNFLLNRDQDSAIEIPDSKKDLEGEVVKLLGETPAISEREELKTVDEVKKLQENLHKLEKSVFYPSLNGFVDVGSQAENWSFDSQSQYYMVGLNLKVPIFSGNQNRNKIKSAELAVESAELDKEIVAQQLTLSSRASQNKLRAAYHNYLSAKKQLKAAKTYHRLIERGYKEGVNSYIETVDARSQLTQAQIALSINEFEMMTAKAKLERETASYDLSDEN